VSCLPLVLMDRLSLDFEDFHFSGPPSSMMSSEITMQS
jgi:hypothetical protein